MSTSDFHIQSAGAGVPYIWAHGLMSSIASEDAAGVARTPPPGIRMIRYDARAHGRTPPAPADAHVAAHGAPVPPGGPARVAVLQGDAPHRAEPSAHGVTAPHGAAPGRAALMAQAYVWEALARDMLAVADIEGAERFIAGGSSMGAMTALSAALLAPERVRALVLMLPPALWEARVASAKRYRAAALYASAVGGEKMAEHVAQPEFTTLPPWLVAHEPDMLAHSGTGTRHLGKRELAGLMRGAAFSNLPPREELQRVAHLPTLILAWSDDTTHPEASAHELHALLPHSDLFIARSHAEFREFGPRTDAFLTRVAAR